MYASVCRSLRSDRLPLPASRHRTNVCSSTKMPSASGGRLCPLDPTLLLPPTSNYFRLLWNSRREFGIVASLQFSLLNFRATATDGSGAAHRSVTNRSSLWTPKKLYETSRNDQTANRPMCSRPAVHSSELLAVYNNFYLLRSLAAARLLPPLLPAGVTAH